MWVHGLEGRVSDGGPSPWRRSPSQELPPTSFISLIIFWTPQVKSHVVRQSILPGAGMSLPGGGGKGEDDAAGEGHRAQAAQPGSPRLAPVRIYLYVSRILFISC